MKGAEAKTGSLVSPVATANVDMDMDMDMDVVVKRRRAVDDIRALVEHVRGQVRDVLKATVVMPPVLHLTGPRGGEEKTGTKGEKGPGGAAEGAAGGNVGGGGDESKVVMGGAGDGEGEECDPALVQYADHVCWEVEQVEPDPGQPTPTPKYSPVDTTQIPRRVRGRVFEIFSVAKYVVLQ